MVEQDKKRGRDSDAAREAILAAAEKRFAEKGFAGARIEKIAEDSGYNKSLLFHYFGDKLGLYQAVVRCLKERRIEELRQLLTPTIAKDTDSFSAEAVQTFIEKAIRMSFDHLVEHPNLTCMLGWEAAEGWETFSALQVTTADIQWVEDVSLFIKRAQQAGFICAEIDPRMLITHVLGSPLIYLLSLPSYQLLLPHTDFTSPEALIHAREQIVEMIVRGVVSPTPPATTPQVIDNAADHQDRAVSTQEKEAHNSL